MPDKYDEWLERDGEGDEEEEEGEPFQQDNRKLGLEPGRRVNRTTVTGKTRRSGKGGGGYRDYRLRCDCGTLFWENARRIISGAVKSCGCWRPRKHPPVRYEDDPPFGTVKAARWDEDRGEWECVCLMCETVMYAKNVAAIRKLAGMGCDDHH